MDVFRCAAGKVAAVLSLIVLLASPATVWAVNAYDILDKNIRSSEMVSPLTSELMGDQVSLYNGATEFKVVDIDLKGNNQLPVQLARRFQIHVHEHGMLTPGGFANTVPEPLNTFGGGWSADVPYIYGAFEASHGWKNGAGHQRCSSMGPPQVSPGVNLSDVWSGYRINIPGEGEMQMLSLTANHTRPADGHIYRWGTSRLHRGRCIPSAIGIAGEGFVFVSSDGITYRFDVAVSRNGGSFYASEINTPIQRTNIYLMASRVEDRHGNYVNYNYVNGALRSIESNDGRRITLNYVGNRIDNAVADAKTWRYGYTSAALTSVTLPDLSAWTYHHIGEPSVMITPIQVIVPDDPLVCGPPHVYSEPYTIEITHPSGATGRFEFLYMGHLISGTPAQAYCYLEYDPISQTHRRSMGIPDFFYNYALTSKTIGGPGLSPKTWTYEYGQPDTGHTNFSGAYCTGCDQEKSVYVKEPDGTMIEHSFSALWGLNNGQLMGKYTRDASNKILRSETHTFVSETEIGSMPFPAIHGDLLGSHDRSSMLNRPIKVTQIAQGGDVAGPPDYTPPQPPPPPPPCQGNDCPPPPPPCERNPVTGVCDDPTVIDDPNANASSVQSASGVPPTIFIRTVTAFDALARPLNEIKSNSLGYSKTDSTTYHDNLSKWVIGQAATQSTNGVQFARTEYDAGAQPHKTYSFGKLQQTLTYHGDGTLATVSDGSDSDNFNSTITLSNWKRGIPQLIQHPATPDQPSGTSQSAAVNDHGEIASITDENGYKTCYGYDVMSRLASITYPDELNIGECDTDDSHWKKTAIEFGGGHAAAYGLPAGHWRQMVSTGNSRKEILFDALWRPVVEQSYDNAHPDATISQVVKRYDVSGRLAFQSYPQRNLQLDYRTVGKGTYTQYDALDRVTKIIQSWEKEAEGFPPLTTTTEYLPGFQTRITNPRNAQTTSGYMAWDQPSYDLPVWIVQSEDAHTHIARDAFGKPTAITRQNGTGSFAVTRHYAYNASQQLCNATEPETGGTLMGYDAAGNLAWSAAGLPANTPCEAEGLSPAILARKVSRTYDARNRLKTLRFPDTRGDQDWSYTADGLPLSITTVNVPGAVHPINQYVYNKRRLPTSETQHMPAWYSYSLGYKYDANGHLERITYPSTDFVDFAPNALGQPTQARNASGHAYAYGVTYHPNGSIAAFTYGNGIVHAMTPNDRQLPKTVRSSGVLEYEYSYDANGNVGAILDKTRDPWGHRYMEYDALDRLTHVGSPTFGELGNGHHMYFTYDALDNLKTWKNPAFDGTMLRDHLYCYNASNQLEQVRSGATTCSNGAMADHFAYDGQGNVDVHDNRGFDFDYGNRLREVMGIERYRYDAHGRRILAMNFGSGTIFSQYGQNGQLLYQKNTRTGQNKQIDHIYLGGSLIAQREQGLTANSPVVVKYQHTDALSSPVAVTDQNRTLIERVDYEPYGKAMNAVTNTGQDRPGYTGHVGDAATQLTYMQQRYYDPSIGRFLSVDPVTANSTTGANFNRYKYAANNPYRFTDPDGRQEREVRDWRSITAKSPGAAAQMATSARSSTSGNSSSSRKSEIKYNAPAPRTVPPFWRKREGA